MQTTILSYILSIKLPLIAKLYEIIQISIQNTNKKKSNLIKEILKYKTKIAV